MAFVRVKQSHENSQHGIISCKRLRDKIHLFLRFHEEFGFSIFPANKIIFVDFSTMKNKKGRLKETNKSGVNADLKTIEIPVAALASTPF